MKRKIHSKDVEKGFSLVEMAVVIVILGFIIGALLLPLQVQRNQIYQSQTERTLEIAKKALLGYAQSQGRLPCPATLASSGMEQPLGGGVCEQQGRGFLPAATLGLQPVDSEGFVLDGWGNRIRYAVTQSNSNAFVTSNGMSNVGISALAPDDIRVCSTSTGITATTCSGINYLINNAVVVIYSTGATAAQGIGGNDELANLNDVDNDGIIDDGVFVSHEPRENDANGEFDHIVTWISPYVLYNAMIEAGQLP
ncbi:MAG: type II secretion system protein [Methylotenera sp.]|uniref:type II secretion system protein n=1 Tax=Methylotenera sp. TaxID=2051956 RepID=UPI0027183E11|nr:type II secretion system protein [Methylotenera sp.]MDO9152061.1 type II secretion system protein [Methylotenera sp.]